MHEGAYPVIILENPKYAGNIGMICRLIGNFSLAPLRIIGMVREYDVEMEWMAYNSKQELSSIMHYSSAKECFSDLDLVVGTSMIHGGNRSQFVPLSKLPSVLSQKKFGIVFGREDRGLSKDTLLNCEYMLDFNLPGYQKSMNLSHSVSFCLSAFHQYNLSLDSLDKTPNQRSTKHFYEYTKHIFHLLDMDNYHNNDYLPVRRLKTILEKAELTSGDIDFLYKIFTNFEKKINISKDKFKLNEK
jgi:TrmH family RNA methyltransferase